MTTILPRLAEVEVVLVLLVEDNDGDARLVELMLQDAFGADVGLMRARSLAEAITRVEQTPEACILLDLGLPDASGLEAVHKIAEYAPGTPIVVLTGQADGEMGTQAVAAGAQDYLVKGEAGAGNLGRAIRYAIVRKHAEDALIQGEQALAEAQRIAHLGSWQLDLVSNAVEWSEELFRLYGIPSSHIPDMDDLEQRVHPDDKEMLWAHVHAAVAGSSPFNVVHRMLGPEGAIRWLRAQGRVERNGAGVPIAARGTVQDITDQKTAEEALAHQAIHDPLTGLPNRSLLLDRLTHALAKLDRSHSAVGLLFVDVDRFKVVNDSLGHPAGDEMLLAMARRLQSTLRVSDTLARFGGDEFVILCEGLADEAEALEIAERIGEAMTRPLSWGGGELVLTVSTGIAVASSSLISAESLLRDADAAMYRAKDDGRARATVFADSMRAKAVGRLDTEVALRRAISDHELELHYQPIVDLRTGTITGMEALVRWRHPVRGLIPPDQFIPIAEETGLIVPLGEWVLEQAAFQARDWQLNRDCASMTMAVNLSACQIAQPDLVPLVARVLDQTGLPPQCLELEITESVLMKDAEAAVKILEALKALGVRLSVDDFGTGYSSLSYLKRFPVDVLKIDRSFVDGLGNDPGDSAIVNAVMSLSTALNLSAVAEGVETTLQMQSLVDLGCLRAQGYYFARPAPAAKIDRLLENQAAAAGTFTLIPAPNPSPQAELTARSA